MAIKNCSQARCKGGKLLNVSEIRVTKAQLPYYIWYLRVIMEEKIRSVEQLVVDEQFLAWYKAENQEAVSAWEAKMAADPSLSVLSGEARVFLNQLRIAEKGLDADQLARANNLFQQTLANSRPAPVRRLFWRWVAAAVLVLGIGTAAWWFTRSGANWQELATNYGETNELTLPDGSHIQLNANSKLKYPDKFNSQSREVWIEGEAFLDVAKTASKTPFIVHTNGYDITVKGTRFNVLARGDRQQVLLTEGAIDLNVQDGATESMQPGDWMIITGKAIEKRQTDGRAVLAWREKQLIFEKATLSEVAERIEEYYGFAVSIDNGLEAKIVSGIFPNNDLDILIETMSASGEFSLVRDNSTLRFSKK